MKIALFALGSRGDVWPLLALGWQLTARGHEVTAAVPEEFREFAQRSGLRTASLPFNGGDWLDTAEGQSLPRSHGPAVLRFLARAYNRHAAAFDAAYLAAADGAEVLVGNIMTWDRVIALGQARRLPVAMVYPVPLLPSRHYTSFFVTRRRLPLGVLRWGSHRRLHRIWWRGNAEATIAFRRKLDLPDDRTPTVRYAERAEVLGLHTVSSSLFPRPADWPGNLKLTGAWRMPAPMRAVVGEEIPDGLREWIEAGEPPIYLGFGSMAVLDREAMLARVVGATVALGRRAIVSADCLPPDAPDRLPDSLRVTGLLDHDELFPRCAAVVHHGGSGSTTASARAGRPSMLCPVFGDQFHWAEQLSRLGVGARVPLEKLDRGGLEAGLCSILDPAVEARARALGARIQAEGDGLPRSAQLFDDWLDGGASAPPVATASDR